MLRITQTKLLWVFIFAAPTLALLATSCATKNAVSEFTASKAVDDYIQKEMLRQRIPGLSLAVLKEGKVMKTAAYGYANLELSAPATIETLYGLGSISKTFTAAAIMLLVEEGKLGLDDKIAKHLAGLPDEWANITLRHLLTHTSGIRDEVWKGGIAEFDRHEYRQEDVIQTAFGPLVSTPGEKYAYRNVGYRLLGMIIEGASGRSYWDFLAERIFKPSGMISTRNSDPKTVIPNRAQGYGLVEGKHVNRDAVTASSAFSEGALISSVPDMIKWDAALHSETILKRSTIAQMWTAVTLNDGTQASYGLGFYVGRTPGDRVIGHGGGLPGFSTVYGQYVDRKLTIIVLTNSESADTQTTVDEILRIYDSKNVSNK